MASSMVRSLRPGYCEVQWSLMLDSTRCWTPNIAAERDGHLAELLAPNWVVAYYNDPKRQNDTKYRTVLL